MPQRTPEHDTRLDNADEIERGLQQDNHRTWGLVIYRCTYESDADWLEFMTRLRYQIQSALKSYNGLDMLDSLDITVFEDRDSLDGASKSAVREQFKKWTATAPELSKVRMQRSPSAIDTASMLMRKHWRVLYTMHGHLRSQKREALASSTLYRGTGSQIHQI